MQNDPGSALHVESDGIKTASETSDEDSSRISDTDDIDDPYSAGGPDCPQTSTTGRLLRQAALKRQPMSEIVCEECELPVAVDEQLSCPACSATVCSP